VIQVIEPRKQEDSVWRILDASANRCREGLRVVEEYVRFHLNDGLLTEHLKTVRHRLQTALQPLQPEQMLAARNTAADVGTQIMLDSERQRGQLQAVVQANCKRVEESLRTLEEYGKLLDPGAAASLEALRYRFYELEQQLWLSGKISRNQQLTAAVLYLLIDGQAGTDATLQTVQRAIAGGVGIVQLRDKQLPDRDLLKLALELRAVTAVSGTLLIMNDRPDLAVLSGADGVHVGQEELSVAQVRRIVGPEMLVGVSTHSLAQAEQAVQEGADYLGVGPVFPSRTKQFDEWVGVELLGQIAAEISLPWFAIGGILPENVAEVCQAGGSRVAVGQGVTGADDPQAAACQLSKILRNSGT